MEEFIIDFGSESDDSDDDIMQNCTKKVKSKLPVQMKYLNTSYDKEFLDSVLPFLIIQSQVFISVHYKIQIVTKIQ